MSEGTKSIGSIIPESELKYRWLIESISDGFAIVDMQGKIMETNITYQKMLGYTAEELSNLTYKDLTPEKWHEFESKIVDEQVLIKGYSEIYEKEYNRKDGTIFPVELRTLLIKNEEGLNEGMWAIVRDITERKEREKALGEIKYSYQELMDKTSDVIYSISMKGEFINLSRSFRDITGWEADEWIGKLYTDLVHPDDLAFAEASFGNVLKDNFSEAFELRILKKSGEYAVGEFKASRLIKEGKNFGILGIGRDITEKRRAEQILKESEERFRSLFENSLIGIAATTLEGKLMQANLAFARMYGYENEQTMKDELPDVKYLYADHRERKAVISEVEKSGSVEPIEVKARKRDGSQIFVLVAARLIKDTSGKPLYIQATHLDLTEHKKIEEKVLNAALYSRNLIEASLDPLVTINAEGKITDVNASTERITGIERRDLIGSDFSDYFTEPNKAREGYRIVFKKGIVRDYPLTLLHTNGSKIDVLYNATVYKNESGEVQGVFAAARDITERKKMEKELQNSKKLLEKLNQHLINIRENERAQIAMNLHDDIGQKLTSINLNISWIKSRMGVQSKSVRDKFEDLSNMIKETINGVQDFSSYLRPAILFDLGLVEAFKSFLSKFEQQSGIICHLYREHAEIKIENEIALVLYRIFQEAMTNIARHSEATVAEITLLMAQNKIELLIKDNGIGIEEEKVNSISSMGIAGIKERVRSLRGSVQIKGEKGSWTFIKVSIPLKIRKKND